MTQGSRITADRYKVNEIVNTNVGECINISWEHLKESSKEAKS